MSKITDTISASEARQRAQSIYNEKNQTQIQKIMTNINTAITKGEFKCFYYDSLLPSVENHLKSEGYQVKSDFGRNEYTITISW